MTNNGSATDRQSQAKALGKSSMTEVSDDYIYFWTVAKTDVTDLVRKSDRTKQEMTSSILI